MVTEKNWSFISVLRLFIGVFLGIGLGAIVVSLLHSGGIHTAPARLRPWILILNTACFQGIILVLAVVFTRENGQTWREAFGFDGRPTGRLLLVAAGTVVLFMPLAFLLQKLVLLVVEWLVHDTSQVQSQALVQVLQTRLSFAEQALFGFSTILVAPLAEEVLFRGILYPFVKSQGQPRLALWGVAFLFGFIHGNLQAGLPLMVFGVILTLLYEWSGNLLAPVLTHACFNGLNFAMLLLGWNPDQVWQKLTGAA